MKTKNLVIVLLVTLQIVTFTFLIIEINKSEKEEVKLEPVSIVDTKLSDTLNLQIDVLNKQIKECVDVRELLCDSLKEIISEKRRSFKKRNEYLLAENVKIQFKADSLTKQKLALEGRIQCLNELVITLNGLNVGKGVKSKTQTVNELQVKLNPSPYFRSYVEIITEDVIISKAIIKNKKGEIIGEYDDPIILNTSRLSSGTYYFSFYDEFNSLVQKAIIMSKN